MYTMIFFLVVIVNRVDGGCRLGKITARAVFGFLGRMLVVFVALSITRLFCVGDV